MRTKIHASMYQEHHAFASRVTKNTFVFFKLRFFAHVEIKLNKINLLYEKLETFAGRAIFLYIFNVSKVYIPTRVISFSLCLTPDWVIYNTPNLLLNQSRE